MKADESLFFQPSISLTYIPTSAIITAPSPTFPSFPRLLYVCSLYNFSLILSIQDFCHPLPSQSGFRAHISTAAVLLPFLPIYLVCWLRISAYTNLLALFDASASFDKVRRWQSTVTPWHVLWHQPQDFGSGCTSVIALKSVETQEFLESFWVLQG